MKKFLRILSYLALGLIVLCLCYGFFLNLTLKEHIGASSQEFYISMRQTDEFYKHGLCSDILIVYPWQNPSHNPTQDYSSKTHCEMVDKENPFDFTYVKSWGNKKDISAFGYTTHPFTLVKKLFFNNPSSICIEGVQQPLHLQENIYSTEWFSVRGLEYSIVMTESDKNDWVGIIKNLSASNDKPAKAFLVKKDSCNNINESDVLKTYPIKFNTNW